MTDDQRLGPPPVEPMSDVSWSRIERGLWSRMDGGAVTKSTDPARLASRRWLMLAAPLAAAAAIAAVVVGTRSPPEVAVNDEPARVVSGSTPSSVSFSDAHVELDAATAVVMSHESGHPIVMLERGTAWFTVAPRLQRPEFIVRAGDATVRVVGTRFRVARSEERISVDVERGLVDVQFRGGVVKVAAGQHWVSESPVTLTASAGSATPAVPAAPATAEPAPLVGSTEPVRDPRRHSETTRTSSSESRHTSKLDAKPEIKLDAKPDVIADARPDATHVAELDRLRAEYDRLAALEARDAAAALTGYLALARGTSQWADLALFAAARLAADRHDSRAGTLLEIYLQRFPRGANAADAKQLLVRLQGARP